MIFLFTGKTGSGKTQQAIKECFKRWKRGEDIYTNTLLLFEFGKYRKNTNIIDHPKNFYLREKVGWKVRIIFWYFLNKLIWLIDKIIAKDKNFISWQREPRLPERGTIRYFEEITELYGIRDGTIFIDEGSALFDARSWESIPEDFSNKLRQHRKHSLDLLTTTQNVRNIEVNYRRLVQVWYHITDVMALFTFRNPNILSLHKKERKNIETIEITDSDALIETDATNFFNINILQRRLYDTYFDVGFRYYKIVWIENEVQKTRCVYLIPKNMTINHALSLTKSLKRKSGHKTFPKSKGN